MGVSGVFLASILTTSMSALGHLPPTILRPVGSMKLIPWSFYDRIITPNGMTALKLIMVASLLLSMVGLFTGFFTKTSAVLVLFYQGLLRSFGHYNHDEMVGVYFLLILAFTPCGDAFSVDSWRRRKTAGVEGFRYGYPVLLMMLLLAWAYFSSALIKLRVAGLDYFNSENLPAMAIYHSLDNLHDTQFKLAFLLPAVRWFLPAVLLGVVIWELLFPVAVFWRSARWWILGAGVVFHLLTLFFMNIFFPHHLLMYLVFVDWDRIIRRIRALPLPGFRQRKPLQDR